MRLGLTVLLLLLALPAGAQARTPQQLNTLVRQAERLYESGQYRESAEKLIEAYVHSPHPRLIYNIARAYDQAGDLELAVEYYQRYVGTTEDADPTLLRRSGLSIDRLRELLKQREQTRRREAEEQARLEAERAEAEQRALREQEARRRAQQQLNQRGASTRRTAAFVLGGAALAGLGTGAGFGLSAQSAKDDFRAAQTLQDKQRLQASTRQRALVADGAFVVGGLSAIAAVLLYPKGSAGAAGVGVLVGPGTAGMEVRF
jgi:tetratricopeptide (TPR) repeat protein